MNTRKIMAGALLLCSTLASAQNYPVNATLEDENSFSMIVIPDPQSYIKFPANQPLFELQTAWIENNIDRLNIVTALCTGDLVEQNDIVIPDGQNGNLTSEEQWSAVSDAFNRLDNKLPYVLCTGNHDYGYRASEHRGTRFNEYFTSVRNSTWRTTLVAAGTDMNGRPTLENAAYEFKSPQWGSILVVSLEFAPRDEALSWAKSVIEDKKYAESKVIILTHSFLDIDGNRIVKEGYKMKEVNYAQSMWDKLIYPSKNIKLVVCGHAASTEGYDKQVSYRSDKNQYGKPVHQMMFNAQAADGQWSGNGGDCWIRILEFKPDGKTIGVKTFSPLFALSPVTKQFAWRTAPYDQFTMVIE